MANCIKILSICLIILFATTALYAEAVQRTNVLKAYDANGLKLQDDGGITYIFIEDGGYIGINTENPAYPLDVNDLPIVLRNSSGTIKVYADSNGISIGTAAEPLNKLDVEGGAVIGATYAGTNTAPSNGALIEGSVGIGLTDPNYELEVNGFMGARAYEPTITDSGDGNAATLTLTPASSLVELTNPDSDGCDVTMGESGIENGCRVLIVNVGTNDVAILNAADVCQLSGGANATLSGGDALELTYSNTLAYWYQSSSLCDNN